MPFSYRNWQSLALVALTAFTISINAHTWVEQLTVIDPNGTFVGAPGFPRGFGKYSVANQLIFIWLTAQ